MSEGDMSAPSRTFVRTLLRSGTPGEPPVTDEESDDAEVVGETTLARACRYFVLAPLLYRLAAFPKVFVAFASSNGSTGLVVTMLATVFAVAATAAAVVWVLRAGGLRAKIAGRALGLDLAVGLLLNVVVAVSAPASIQPYAVDVSWTWLVASIAMWMSSFGVPTSLWLLVAAVPVRAGLTLAGGLPLTHPVALNRSVGCMVALLVAIVTSAGILVLLGVGTRFALDVGLRRGQQAERRRTRRIMHDSVLQTLEALALATPGDEKNAAKRLSEVRALAKAEAADLRRQITEPLPTGSTRSLVVELAEVAAETARDGLRTQLVAADLDEDYALSQARRTAMCDAVRESLRNTVKHAATKEVVLRVEERDGGIAVVARDHGQGFDVRHRPPGFGISQSIMARLAEVNGHGTVDSRPGHGTKVTLWVPR